MDRAAYIAAGRQSKNIRDLRPFTGRGWYDAPRSDPETLNAITTSPSYIARLAVERPAFAPGARMSDTPQERAAAVAGAVEAARVATNAPQIQPFFGQAQAQESAPDIPKIKRNIKRMIDGGASEAEIDTYLGHEGVTSEQLRGAGQPASGAQPQAPGQAPATEDGSFLDPLMQGVTLGSADEIKGALRGGARYMFGDNPGKSFGDLYGEEVGAARGNLEAFRTRNPWGSIGAEIGGAGLGVLATGGASLIPKAASTLGKIGLGALEGGALSGLYGFNAGEGGLEERAKSAARSAPFGAAAGAAAGGLAGVLSRGAKSAAAPALDELRTAASAAFQQVDNSGATITPRTSGLIVDDIVRLASKQRINEKLHPKAYAALQDVLSLRGQTPRISDLHQVRQILGDAASSIDPADRRMASLFIDALDNRLDRLSAFDVAGGDPKATVAALREGMATWRRLRKGEVVAKIFSDAEIDAGAKYTQAGMETAVRNGFKRLAKNDKALRGFTMEEVAAIRKAAAGGPLENVFRFFGKFAPRGVISALPTMAAASYDLGIGAATLGVGEGSRRIATLMTMRNARLADELIRRGAPARAAKPLSAAGQSALALTMGTGLPAWPMIERAAK